MPCETASSSYLLISGLQTGQLQRCSGRSFLWRLPSSCQGFSQQCYYSTQEVEKEPEKESEEEPLHTIISDTESVQGDTDSSQTLRNTIFCQIYADLNFLFFLPGSFSKHEFQAETKKLLDIVARSLYSEKEVRGRIYYLFNNQL